MPRTMVSRLTPGHFELWQPAESLKIQFSSAGLPSLSEVELVSGEITRDITIRGDLPRSGGSTDETESAGFSLVEVLVAAVILFMVVTASLVIYRAAMSTSIRAESALRLSMDIPPSARADYP